MSWSINATGIGARLTVENLNEAIKRQGNYPNEADEQLVAVGALLRNELRRIEDANVHSQYEFHVSASGHTDAASNGPGNMGVTLSLAWKHQKGT